MSKVLPPQIDELQPLDVADLKVAAASGLSVELDQLIIGSIDEPISAPKPAARTEQPIKILSPEGAAKIGRLLGLCEKAHKAGDYNLLKQHLRAIHEIDPDNAQAHFNLGVVNRDMKLYPEAEADFRRAIQSDPKNPVYHLALGELMQIMRHLLFAAAAYEAGLAIDPNNTKMLTALTDVRQKQRMPREVAELSRRSLALDPNSVGATMALAWALIWLGEFEEAAEVAGRAIAYDPQSLHAAVMLQVALSRLDRKDAAVAALADIEARSLKTWENCAAATDAFIQLNEEDTAERLLRLIVDQRPNFVPALLQLGRFMILKSDIEEGFKLMSRVVELNPEEGDAQTSVSLSLVFQGKFEEGWARHHWRWKRTGCEPRWDLTIPEWQGQRLDGSLLVWREQGIGDMVMYVAPVLLCRERAQKIIIETNPRLRTLMKRSFPDMAVVCREELPQDFFETENVVAHCPIGELPHLLKVDMANYPGRNGFLTANPTDTARLRERYQLLFPNKRLVGISWRSGNSSSAVARSAELPLWMPIFETPDCAFISLQYGDVSKDVTSLREEYSVEVYIDSEIDAMRDMDKFTAQVAAVDCVISVDNSTVHFAGALGKTTWALIPSAADWRWLTREHVDTVWYRSVELLRQAPRSNWNEPIKAAAARLRALSSEQIEMERRAIYLRCAQQSYAFGDINTSELYYRQILVRDKSHAEALAGLGRIALDTGHTDDAISWLRRAINVAPHAFDYHRDLAKALYAGNRQEQAFAALRNALRLKKDDKVSLTLAVEILRHMDLQSEAANYCARLLRLEPDHREARLHLAQIQAGVGDFDVAETNFKRVLAEHPEDDIARFSLGCLALRRQDFTVGWAGFARRFQAGLMPPQSELSLPFLAQLGDRAIDISSERIAVRPEPGLRDQILFMRWLVSLRRETNFITAELDPRLIPLLDQSATRVSLFPTGSLRDEEASDLNLTSQVSLGDLGSRYGEDVKALGVPVPYLKFDREKAASLRRDYLAALGVKRLIGICWRGGNMAVPLINWLPILRFGEFGFVSLQAGPAQQEMHEVFDGLGLSAVRDPAIDPQTNLRAFVNQLAAVDLVISIDEVPLHLAGALGLPALGLIPQIADWRWFGNEDIASPWYPSLRIYRQSALEQDWSTTMAAIVEDLMGLIVREG